MAQSLAIPSRRGFLAGLAGLFVCAPAIVRASSIMPVKALSLVQEGPVIAYPMLGVKPEWANSLLTISMITREAIKLFENSNEFIRNIDRQYDEEFFASDASNGYQWSAKIGNTIRVMLPADFKINKTTSLA
jgi:hypothetical protein